MARNSTGIHSFSYHFGGKPCYSWDWFIERLVLVGFLRGSIVGATIFGVHLAIAGISCW